MRPSGETAQPFLDGRNIKHVTIIFTFLFHCYTQFYLFLLLSRRAARIATVSWTGISRMLIRGPLFIGNSLIIANPAKW